MTESLDQIAQSLIGLCLSGTPLEPISPEDFPGLPYDRIWQAMQDLVETRVTPTAPLVMHAVGGDLPGLSLADLQRYVAEATGETRPLAEALRAQRGRQVLQAGLDGGLTVEEIYGHLHAEYPGPIARPAKSAISTYDGMVAGWQTDRYIDSGLVRIPDGEGTLTCGPYRQEILTIGARFRHGKSSFATNLAARWARSGLSVRILTLEESEESFQYRLVSLLSAEDHHPIKYRQFKRQGPTCPPAEVFTCAQHEWIKQYADALDSWPLAIEYISPLKSKAFLKAVEASDEDILILDYIQQYMPMVKGETRTNVLQRAIAALQDMPSGKTRRSSCCLN
jgi:DnaB helicase-like protein